VVFANEYIKRCSPAEWIARNGCALIWCRRGVWRKLRKLWDSLSELRSSLCERRLEKTVLRPALLPVKMGNLLSFFPSGMTSHSKIVQFNWEWIGRFIFQSSQVNDVIVPQQVNTTSLSVPSNKLNSEIVLCHSGLNKFCTWTAIFKTRSIHTSYINWTYNMNMENLGMFDRLPVASCNCLIYGTVLNFERVRGF
jgi:hypothetical protein